MRMRMRMRSSSRAVSVERPPPDRLTVSLGTGTRPEAKTQRARSKGKGTGQEPSRKDRRTATEMMYPGQGTAPGALTPLMEADTDTDSAGGRRCAVRGGRREGARWLPPALARNCQPAASSLQPAAC